MDAAVFDERSSGGAGAITGGFGVGSADAGNGAAPAVDGCGAAGEGGAQAIVERILDTTSEAGGWLRHDQSCSKDSDCHSALLTPLCDSDRALCVPCQDPQQQRSFSLRLAGCLTRAIARCCSDPQAARDCVFRDCVGGCDLQ